MPTPWRRQLYKGIARLDLSGAIVDLGGSKKSGYHGLIKGEHAIAIVNLDDSCRPDLRFDLEKPFAIKDGSYDAALAFNVLEHICDYASFLLESRRILKTGGTIVIGVPFLMHVHPSPHDYWRYTAETLQKILGEAGFADIEIRSIGRGPFTASVQLLSGAPFFSLAPVRATFEGIALALDATMAAFMGKEKLRDRYPLGYLVVAKK
jgi:SAM-dependent methyltransferase